MMTRKQFQAVADLFREAMEDNHYSHTDTGYIIGRAAGIEAMAQNMADFFEKENPRFDREKFLDACGMGA